MCHIENQNRKTIETFDMFSVHLICKLPASKKMSIFLKFKLFEPIYGQTGILHHRSTAKKIFMMISWVLFLISLFFF